ncbi:MAG: zf-HC2 domain-containing protein [Candidatus Hydrogenedentes bacterium]|nr:zf-HC2 domain-containing protein [Candidatus Hydrogenedentota bacterium]
MNMECPQNERLVEFSFQAIHAEAATREFRALAAHLEVCPTCEEQVSDYVKLIRRVRRVLADSKATPEAGPCLDDNTLAEYLDGVLGGTRRDEAEAHLAQCRTCLRQLIELSDLMEEVKTAHGTLPTIVLGLVRGGLKLLSWPETGFAPLALEPVRVLGPVADDTKDTQNVCAWTQNLGELRLAATAIYSSPQRIDLALTATTPAGPAAEARLTLRCADTILQAERLSSSGQIVLHNLEPATYEIELVPRNDAPHAFQLTLRPSN